MYREYIAEDPEASEASLSAALHIDVLAGFRIRNFRELTAFQQSIITLVHDKLAEFERENADILEMPLTSYTVNGVSMAFGDKIKSVNGVTIPADLYSLLCSTGLCYPAV